MKYRLVMFDQDGKEVASRKLDLKFDRIGIDDPRTKGCEEEFRTAMKAKEMYRDAAWAAGKWPFKDAITGLESKPPVQGSNNLNG